MLTIVIPTLLILGSIIQETPRETELREVNLAAMRDYGEAVALCLAYLPEGAEARLEAHGNVVAPLTSSAAPRTQREEIDASFFRGYRAGKAQADRPPLSGEQCEGRTTAAQARVEASITALEDAGF